MSTAEQRKNLISSSKNLKKETQVDPKHWPWDVSMKKNRCDWKKSSVNRFQLMERILRILTHCLFIIK